MPRVAALGLVLLAMLQGDLNSRLLRFWVDWNYTGLEAKELWPAFDAMTRTLQGTVADPRVAVEYNALHEKAGSIRMYEMIPHFIGRPTLEGVYNQASLMTHPVYYLASEMGASSPNPFKSRYYSRFDVDAALVHLRLLHAGDVVALSRELTVALHQRAGVSEIARVPPYTVFRLPDPGGYVEPLSHRPVRSSLEGWRDKAYRWFTRKPLSPAHLVFTDDPQAALLESEPWLVERDAWLPPPEDPLPGGTRVTSEVEAERIRIHTDRPGHPLLVKVSYHPRWRATGADGPYLIAPGLMMVVPRSARRGAVLRADRGRSRRLGAHRARASLVVAVAAARRRWPAAVAPTAPVWPKYRDSCALPPPGRQWGFVIPTALAVALCAARGLSYLPKASPVPGLMERASSAYAAERFADAAEYARHALDLQPVAGAEGRAPGAARREPAARGAGAAGAGGVRDGDRGARGQPLPRAGAVGIGARERGAGRRGLGGRPARHAAEGLRGHALGEVDAARARSERAQQTGELVRRRPVAGDLALSARAAPGSRSGSAPTRRGRARRAPRPRTRAAPPRRPRPCACRGRDGSRAGRAASSRRGPVTPAGRARPARRRAPRRPRHGAAGSRPRTARSPPRSRPGRAGR